MVFWEFRYQSQKVLGGDLFTLCQKTEKENTSDPAWLVVWIVGLWGGGGISHKCVELTFSCQLFLVNGLLSHRK